MVVYTAPETIYWDEDKVYVFLAGGITDCRNWQEAVIEGLEQSVDSEYQEKTALLNPRRKFFPENKSARAAPSDYNIIGKEQIAWEYNALNRADIFSVWFERGVSSQPIALYELGRQVALRFTDDRIDSIVIGAHQDYRRFFDVYEQMKNVSLSLAVKISYELTEHIDRITNAVMLEHSTKAGKRKKESIIKRLVNYCINRKQINK